MIIGLVYYFFHAGPYRVPQPMPIARYETTEDDMNLESAVDGYLEQPRQAALKSLEVDKGMK